MTRPLDEASEVARRRRGCHLGFDGQRGGGERPTVLDTTVVNVALPALSRGLHTSTTGLQWVVDGYSPAFAALLLSGGAHVLTPA